MPDILVSPADLITSDGVVPVYDPNARWCWWNINEIYIGTEGHKRYVPKVDDYVIDSDQYITYIVESINPDTLVATLREITPLNSGNTFTEDDLLFGVGPGTQADTYRVYLDTGVIPHILAVDARLKVGGTMASYAKIFKGSDVSGVGKVISRLYDQSGNMLTQNIPLELAAIDSHTNHSIRVVSVCYTNDNLVDGELVTVVIYNDTGHVVSKRQLLVENTAFIRSVNSSQKYISHISLESPFLSDTADHLIEFPLNVPVNGMGLMGVVYYSDGSKLRMPVDGTKFKMFGMDQYVATIVGQRLGLVLSYTLSPDELVYGAVTSDGKHITKPYTLMSTVQNGAYAVKLFGYPVWINSILGYRMEWFLYNLDRNVTYRVTDYVRFNANTGSFRPMEYGVLQQLSVSINLRDVSGAFKSYIHTQSIAISLLDQGGTLTTNWTIGFDSNQIPPYGIDLFATAHMVNQNLWEVKIDSEITTQEQWLHRVYYNTKPLMDRKKELTPPTPNFFAIVTNTGRTEFPLSYWNTKLNIGHGIQNNGTMFIEFFRRTATTDIQLSIAGLSTRNI